MSRCSSLFLSFSIVVSTLLLYISWLNSKSRSPKTFIPDEVLLKIFELEPPVELEKTDLLPSSSSTISPRIISEVAISSDCSIPPSLISGWTRTRSERANEFPRTGQHRSVVSFSLAHQVRQIYSTAIPPMQCAATFPSLLTDNSKTKNEKSVIFKRRLNDVTLNTYIS
jgi:hypothetical protein